MSYNITDFSLVFILRSAAELGAKKALCATGLIKPYLSKAEAFRLFGRANVESWIGSGLLTPRKDGDHSSCWRIGRLEAESIKCAMEIIRIL
ncbi:hypothetical protein HQN86_12530 [Pedobacter panaciterrae]|uniref:hypothetical protein n=1 Tax=Pedobacter panaciterrae TaxID=363849 RepID=UPI00155DC5BA|nr:hypothetical protein [Pedobacter panaciterrae]NQX54443.1 hypothetical protein [Pedobacter panaciterrae]